MGDVVCMKIYAEIEEQSRHSSLVEAGPLTNKETRVIFKTQLGYILSSIIAIRPFLSREGGVKSRVLSEDKMVGLPKSVQP